MFKGSNCKPKNKRGNVSHSRAKLFLVLCALFIVIGGGVVVTRAWTPPTAQQATFDPTTGFPAANIANPVNTSIDPQSKAGSLGIGMTTSPGYKLDVNGIANASQYCISGANCISAWPSSGVGGTLAGGTTNYVSKWSSPTSLTNSLIFDNGTNVGIGTPSPTELLHIRGTTSKIWLENLDSTSSITTDLNADTPGLLLTTKTNTGGPSFGSALMFGSTDTSLTTENPKVLAGIQLTFGQNLLEDNDASGGLAFFTSGINAGNYNVTEERMRIDRAGNVGIGTTTPGEKLQVLGRGIIGNLNSYTELYAGFGAQTAYTLDIGSKTETAVAAKDFGSLILSNNTTAVTGIIGSIVFANRATGGDLRIAQITAINDGAVNSGRIAFITNNAGTVAERMRLTSAGNVGIGTTSPDSLLYLYKNDGVNNAEIALQSGNGTTVQNKWAIYNNGIGTSGNDGSLRFWNASVPSGGGNALTILNNGHVGIGAVAPLARLHIQDATVFSTLPSDSAVNLLIQGGGTLDTANAVQSSIGFVPSGRPFPQAAIVSVLTTADRDSSGLAFYTHPGAGPTDVMAEAVRITNTGYVGIGTTSPKSKLQVVGLLEYADNVTAIANGLTVGAFYRTGDILKVVH